MLAISKIRYLITLLVVFIIPIAFNPYSSDIFNSIKGILLVLLTSILLLLWAIESYLNKKLSVKVTWVNSLVLLAFLVSLLTILSNTPLISSWFGQSASGITSSLFGQYSTLGTGFISITALTFLYFCFVNTINSETRIKAVLRVFSLSGVLAVIVSFLRYVFPNIDLQNNPINIIFKGYSIVNPSFPTLYPSQNFSPSGEYFIMPIFTLICSLILLYLIRNHEYKKVYLKFIDFLLLFILVFGFVVTSSATIFNYEGFSIFPYAFYILGVLSLIFFLYKFDRNLLTLKNIKKDANGISYMIAGIATITGIVVLLGGKLVQYVNPIIPFGVSWSAAFIALGSSLKNGFLGIGPENFSVTYLQSRPVGINNTNIAFDTINHAGNFVLEIISNYGLIGLAVFAFIVIKIALYFVKNKNENNKLVNLMMIIFGILLVYLFILPINLTMLFVVYVMMAMLASIDSLDKENYKNLVIALKNSSNGLLFLSRNNDDKRSEQNIAYTLFLVISFILFLTASIFSYNLFMGHYYYSESFRQASNAQDEKQIEDAMVTSAKSIQSFGQADEFYNRLAALSFNKYSKVLDRVNKRIQDAQKDNKNQTNAQNNQNNQNTSDPTKNPTTSEANELNAYVKTAVDNSDMAIKTNPLNYENYYLASQIAFQFAQVNKDQYLQRAADMISNAITLNPQNSYLYLLAGDIYAYGNNFEMSRNALINSLNKFPTLDGFQKLAQLYYSAKQYDAAIEVLKNAQSFIQSDSDLYKSIDKAIAQISDDKSKDPNAQAEVKKDQTPVPSVTPKLTPTPTPAPKKK